MRKKGIVNLFLVFLSSCMVYTSGDARCEFMRLLDNRMYGEAWEYLNHHPSAIPNAGYEALRLGLFLAVEEEDKEYLYSALKFAANHPLSPYPEFNDVLRMLYALLLEKPSEFEKHIKPYLEAKEVLPAARALISFYRRPLTRVWLRNGNSAIPVQSFIVRYIMDEHGRLPWKNAGYGTLTFIKEHFITLIPPSLCECLIH